MFSNVVSTTLKVLTGCILAIILTLYFCIASAFSIKIDPVIFGEMLTFAATFAGIAYASFRTKRLTELVPEESVTRDEMGHVQPPVRVKDVIDARVVRVPARRSRYDVGVRMPATAPTKPIAPRVPVDQSARDDIAAMEDTEGY